jgi:hypothetical protein
MSIKTARNLRRMSQIVFFGVFFWLVLKTTFEVGFNPVDGEAIRLPYPVSIALEFDPLVALMTLLSGGTIYKGLLWSLVILVPTVFLGRFFCGWICPLGTLNHWVSEVKAERNSRKGARRADSNRYRPYQRIKYYVLLVCIGCAVAGTLQAGLLDPLPLLARSIGTFVLPMTHAAADATLGWFNATGFPPLMGAHSPSTTCWQPPSCRPQGALQYHPVDRRPVCADTRSEPLVHPFLVSRHLPAGRSARHLLPVGYLWTSEGPRGLRSLQSLPAPLSGSRQS